MTRENKAGLAVAGVFLSLATTVGVMKWRDVPGRPSLTMSVPPAAATEPVPPKAAKVAPRPVEKPRPVIAPRPVEAVPVPVVDVLATREELSHPNRISENMAAAMRLPVGVSRFQEVLPFDHGIVRPEPTPEELPSNPLVQVSGGQIPALEPTAPPPPPPAPAPIIPPLASETPKPPAPPGGSPTAPEIVLVPSAPPPAPPSGMPDLTPPGSVILPNASAAPLVVEPSPAPPPPVSGGAPLPPIDAPPPPPAHVPGNLDLVVKPLSPSHPLTPATPMVPAGMDIPLPTPAVPAPPPPITPPPPPAVPAPTNPAPAAPPPPPAVVKGPAEKTSSGTPLEGSRFVPTVTVSPPRPLGTQPPLAGSPAPKGDVQPVGNREPVKPPVGSSPTDGLRPADPLPSLQPTPVPMSRSSMTLPSSTLPSAQKTDTVRIGAGGTAVVATLPKVSRFDTSSHACKQGDTWESVCERELLTRDYTEALRAFNMELRGQSERIKNGDPLQAGDVVQVPSTQFLESKFPTLIRRGGR